ncbi:MAG: hypothetical protein HC863_03230 [Myxococcales bacterium]|nr:hypothetical protein [Myxococcales bacterium]
MGLASVGLTLLISPAFAEIDVAPSPPSIGADVPVTYFGPPPSSVEPELIGPYQLLKSGTIDQRAGTITLPLYRGQMRDSGQPVWFILTDTTDAQNGPALGLNVSGKLKYADTCRGVRRGVVEQDASVTFDLGTVDFSPQRSVTPGAAPSLFPPTAFQPGSVGDEFYTPLVRLENAGNQIYNAPVIAQGATEEQLNAFCDKDADHSLVHDRVLRICPARGTVTMQLVAGFSFARPVLYISTDSNSMLAASMEAATYAPGLEDVAVGRDDSAFSAVERLFAMINGPTNLPASETGGAAEINPQRQGFNSALAGQGGPLNVLGGIPTIATDYSPLWDLNVGQWTDQAIANGFRSRVTEEFQILGLVKNGFITGPGGAPYGSSGIIVNCPIVHRFL